MIHKIIALLCVFSACIRVVGCLNPGIADEASTVLIESEYMRNLRPILEDVLRARSEEDYRSAHERLVSRWSNPSQSGGVLSYSMYLTRSQIWRKQQLLGWQEVAAGDYCRLFKKIGGSDGGEYFLKIKNIAIQAYKNDPTGVMKNYDDIYFIKQAISTFEIK